MPVLTRGSQLPVWKKLVVGMKMGSLSSPVVTSYRLPTVTIGLSLAVFAVLQLVTDRQTDRQTSKCGNFIGRQIH